MIRTLANCLCVLLLLGLHKPVAACYADDPNPYLGFATRTSIRALPGDQSAFVPEHECTPVRVWTVVRAGTSWPQRTLMDKLRGMQQLRDDIVLNYQHSRTKLCAKDIDNLRKSDFPPKLAKAGELSAQGAVDMEGLGKELKKQFPSLLNNLYSPQEYKFLSTKRLLALQSAIAFARGLFGEAFDTSELRRPLENSPDRDTFLDLPSNCDAWKGGVIGACAADRLKFDGSKKMQTLITDVSTRLGFLKPLELGSIILMHQGCGLQKATEPISVASWCAVFTIDELKLLEYRDDLLYHRACGPGDYAFLVSRLSCPLVQDLIQTFDSVDRKDAESAVFYFTGEKSLLILLHGLGLADGHLGDEGGLDQRLFRSASLAPSGGHLTAALYRCSHQADLQVGLYLHGRSVAGGLRPWVDLRRELASFYLDSAECAVESCRSEDFAITLGNFLRGVASYGVVVTLFGGLLAMTPV